ncbi:helix-turn-helix domain-containing protein [Uliginosibacterium aquaticum]|uniref:Helix-turn-helix transcriptional regulator n=1 Tax=Uliginosibacterium aquaticum TaxID=2731212 RepID=A0ABX2IJT8_9RHOO|nr:helix-turn-helix transcriptional regulator [Uliginosibacterium aquaticum]NSL54909.1 helix-turn-helix transcriptional regulator [Uliginosibacterium aquaticum]
MKPIYMYMDEAIEMGAVKNDSELAAKLGLSRASVSAWRNGKTAPDDEQAIALARLIGKPEIELMAEAAAHRAKTSEARTYWERIAKYSATATGVAATWVLSLFAVAMMAGYSPRSEAKTFDTYPTESRTTPSSNHSASFYYVKLRGRKSQARERRWPLIC